MLPSRLGCPHDYALTPRDMQKLARADILVLNGLGLEEFLGAPVRKANPAIQVLDSSAGIDETLENSDSRERERGKGQDSPHVAGTNPHLFVSPRMVAKLAMNIADGLSRVDSGGAVLYLGNARIYAARMDRLASELASLGRSLKTNRIVEPHGVFDYLARDMGLEIVAVMQPDGQEPSAAEMIELVQATREKKVGAIFLEPQYPEKLGRTVSMETGIPVVLVDPVATGPENASLDYYEAVMRGNMKAIEAALGKHEQPQERHDAR